MLRRSGQQLLGRLGQQLRGYAAEPALTGETSPFLRFGSPFAQQLDLSQAVAQLPETKVGSSPGGEILAPSAAGPGLEAYQPVPPPARPRRPTAFSATSFCFAAGDPPAQRLAGGQRAGAALQHLDSGGVD